MLGEATAQSRCQTLCNSEVNWKKQVVGSRGGTCPSAP